MEHANQGHERALDEGLSCSTCIRPGVDHASIRAKWIPPTERIVPRDPISSAVQPNESQVNNVKRVALGNCLLLCLGAVPSPRVLERCVSETLRPVYIVRSMPSTVVADLLTHVAFGRNGGVADRGETYNATDIIKYPERPTRRFLFGAVDDRTAVLAYEHGGRGYHIHVVAYDVSGARAVPLFNVVGPVHSIPELQHSLRTGVPELKESTEW